MIGTVGDLVEDVVVRLGGPVHEASDTSADVVHRRGGSAANMAAAVARAGHPARFIGQVGDDAQGRALVESLRGDGVDVVARHAGRTGTIVVLVDHDGERSMLTDRGAATGLDRPERSWLTGLDAMHVPIYSLIGEPLAHTTVTLIDWAHSMQIPVSIDASSSAVISDFGAESLLALVAELQPSVFFCNEREADALGHWLKPRMVGADVIVIKRGARPASVIARGAKPVDVPALTLADVRDTTGAGDAFAAGFLIAQIEGKSLVESAERGHDLAARAIVSASS